MTNLEQYFATFKIEDGRLFQAVFDDINGRDGFEISLGMYRANLGPVNEEVFRRFAAKFDGVVKPPVE
ncbi:MAG: hypothetical protein ACXVP5_10470 [Tumebacillaceae bacterium]